MNGVREAEERWPDWLAETVRALRRLERGVRLRPGVLGLALRLLLSLELDDLPAPRLSLVSVGRGQSGLVITWSTGGRWLLLEVPASDRFGLGARDGRGELRCRYYPARGPDGVNEFRKAVGELYRDAYPRCHAGRVAEGRA